MKDGVRVLNVARGPLVVDEALKDALDSGKVAGAALDVFREEPITEHPLFGYPNVVVTPHLGASTAEATDRAGFQAAEQVVAALTGGAVTTAVNVPAIAADDLVAVEPFIALCLSLGRIAAGLAPTSLESLEVEFLGRVAERDTRLLTSVVLKGALQGHTEEDVNDVNALALAAERGIAVSTTAAGRPRLHRPRPGHRPQRRGAPPASSGRCSASGTAHTCSRRGDRASTSSSSRISRCSATATSPGCSAASARVRRRRHQHRLRRGRSPGPRYRGGGRPPPPRR